MLYVTVGDDLCMFDEKEFKKQFSLIKNKVFKKIRTNKCALCKKETSGMCNSHSIPRFILKNIAFEKGYFNNWNSLYGFPDKLINKTDGLKKQESSEKYVENVMQESLKITKILLIIMVTLVQQCCIK